MGGRPSDLRAEAAGDKGRALRQHPHVMHLRTLTWLQPARLRARPRGIVFVALVLLFGLPGEASAQSRFGLQLDLGVGLPLSASLHNVVTLDVDAASESTESGIPTLSRQTNRLGLHTALMAHVGTLELRYSTHRFAWNERLRDCVGDRSAQRLPNGEISDAEVRYQCADEPERERFVRGELAPLVLHHLGAGARFYLRRQAATDVEGRQSDRAARLYAVTAAGVSAAQYRDANLGRVVRGGGHASLGAGTEVRIDRAFSFTLDLRYTLSMVGASSAPSARSTRAIATQRNVLNALLDVFHQIGLTAGIRFDVR